MRWLRLHLVLVFFGAFLHASCVGSECGSSNLITTESPEETNFFEVRDANGSVIWRVEKIGAPVMLQQLRLGEIPKGFRQIFPAGGPPRYFNTGEVLTMHKDTPKRTLRHSGRATGRNSFCGGFYEFQEK